MIAPRSPRKDDGRRDPITGAPIGGETPDDYPPPFDPDCLTCTEPGSGKPNECPKSKRVCGHHCNCLWIQDICHWCGVEVQEDGSIPNVA